VYELFLLLATCTATLAERDGFTLCYDTQNRRPLWTIHQPQPSTTPTPRKHWRKDHALNSLPAKAFTNTGFDRGHLATAADLPESQDAFLTSNAVPQDPALNRGPWRALENKLRNRRPVRVLTGAVYANCGNEIIEAPCFLYKIAIFDDGQILAHYATNAPPRP
jgi:endonuclease G